MASSCTAEQMLDYHRSRNPDGPYSYELCKSPSETGTRWDCRPEKVRQLRREARIMVRLARAYLARTACYPGNPSGCAALIRREFEARGLSGSDAVSVANCESSLDPDASNGSHDGLFQQSRTYWPGRAQTYGVAGRSPFDPMANIVVSAGMVRDTGGWSHWSCKP